jgi:tetratricopeptide (TPR) repeat protein
MDSNDLKSQAETAYQKKNFKLAANLYSEAANVAEESLELLEFAELRNNASVAFLQANEPNSAYKAALNSENIFKEIGDKKRHAMALGNQAAALEALGRKQEAIKMYIEAEEILKGAGENDLRSYVLKRISSLQIQNGKQFEALGSMHAALENSEKLTIREKTLKRLTTYVMNLLRRG